MFQSVSASVCEYGIKRYEHSAIFDTVQTDAIDGKPLLLLNLLHLCISVLLNLYLESRCLIPDQVVKFLMVVPAFFFGVVRVSHNEQSLDVLFHIGRTRFQSLKSKCKVIYTWIYPSKCKVIYTNSTYFVQRFKKETKKKTVRAEYSLTAKRYGPTNASNLPVLV